MGVVYLAEDPRLHRQVAIKTVELARDDPEQREFLLNRLMRDAQAAAALSHPNIVPVYDVMEESTVAYVVMEYVDGESLAVRLRRVGRPEPSFTLRVLREMAAALDYTHGRGVIHRDIKPGNVMIDAAGKAKIMDFGIARIADSRTNTPTGMVMGTIHYMAPEQIKGEPVDGRCDQFALGAVAYEMLTGASMFGAQSIATLAYKIVNEDPPLMRTLNDKLPEAMEAVIRKALAKQPAQRFASCGEFVNALEAAYAGQASNIGVPDREAPTTTMRVPASVLAPATAPAPAIAAAPQPAAKASGSRAAAAVVGVVLVAGVGAVLLWKPWATPSPAAVSQKTAPPAQESRPPSVAENTAPPPATKHEASPKSPERAATNRTPDPPAKATHKEPPPQPEVKPVDPPEEPEPETESGEKGSGPAFDAWRQGNQLEATGDHAGAIAAYSRAILIKPRYAAAFTNRGLAHFRQRDFADAVVDYSHAIDILPKYARAYVLRGNANAQLKHNDQALGDYSRAIELKPELPAAWGGRGVLYLHESKFQRALSDLNEAIKRAPRQEIWYENRATTRRGMGDEAGARADQEQAKKIAAHKQGKAEQY
jgi:serine/threonine-protein kinase